MFIMVFFYDLYNAEIANKDLCSNPVILPSQQLTYEFAKTNICSIFVSTHI